MTFRRTRQCDQDLIDIYSRGGADLGVEQAEHYYAKLIDTFNLLADHPRMARERSEFKPPVRLHPFRSHMIVDAVEGADILIVRVLHGRRDWERHLA